jgi:hypothetical protein
VAALTLPTIVGVTIFSAVALMPSVPPTNFDPNADWGLRGIFGLLLMIVGFFGTAYGPALIPVAVVVALGALRRGLAPLWLCWVLIVLSVFAAAVGYVWALDAVELP